MAGSGGQGSYGAATIGTTTGPADRIVGGRSSRNGLVVQNAHASNTLYVGSDSAVTTATGLKVVAGDSAEFPDYVGPIYGVASGASTDVRYFEVF